MQRQYIIACLIALFCLEAFGPCRAKLEGRVFNNIRTRVIDPTTPRDGGVR